MPTLNAAQNSRRRLTAEPIAQARSSSTVPAFGVQWPRLTHVLGACCSACLLATFRGVDASGVLPLPLSAGPQPPRARTDATGGANATYPGLARLPLSAQNTFLGEPEDGTTRMFGGRSRDRALYDVRENASLWGSSDLPQDEDLYTSPQSSSMFNAMLGSMASVRPELLRARILALGADPRVGLFTAVLYHLGQAVGVPVDPRFYRIESPYAPDYVGNAHALDEGAQAYWPAVLEKAFVKLIDSFPDTYRYRRSCSQQYGSSNEDEAGYFVLSDAKPEAAVAALAGGEVFRVPMDQGGTAVAAARAAIAWVQRGDAAGILTTAPPDDLALLGQAAEILGLNGTGPFLYPSQRCNGASARRRPASVLLGLAGGFFVARRLVDAL